MSLITKPEIPELISDFNNVYQYAYFFDFDDKVYYARADANVIKNIKSELPHIKKSHIFAPGNLKDNYHHYNQLNNDNQRYIKDFLCEHISSIVGEIVIDIDFKFEGYDDIWVNEQHAGEYSPLHNHGGLFSFVWYLDIPEEIRKEHLHQNSNTFKETGLIGFMSERTNQRMTFNPNTADVFIFNSNHLHQVYPFYSDVTRISMAGNLYSYTTADGKIVNDLTIKGVN